jgi:lipoate-protein ligase B
MSTSWTRTSSPSSPRAEPVRATGLWQWLGRVPFARTAVLQEKLRSDIRDHGAAETLLLLEHDPVITLGRSALPHNVLHSESWLAAQGISLHRASRGGDVTYHGPGQLVGYPVIHLRGGVRAHVEGMALALADVLAELGVEAHYRREAPGLWVGPPGKEAKICAFGVNVHHRITIHGFALNLDPDLDRFGLIVPCGLPGCKVTSVRALRGAAPAPVELSARVAEALAARLGVAFASSGALSELHYSERPIE